MGGTSWFYWPLEWCRQEQCDTRSNTCCQCWFPSVDLILTGKRPQEIRACHVLTCFERIWKSSMEEQKLKRFALRLITTFPLILHRSMCSAVPCIFCLTQIIFYCLIRTVGAVLCDLNFRLVPSTCHPMDVAKMTKSGLLVELNDDLQSWSYWLGSLAAKFKC